MKWLNAIAIRFLARHQEHEVPANARLYWVWEVKIDRPHPDYGHDFEILASPAYRGVA